MPCAGPPAVVQGATSLHNRSLPAWAQGQKTRKDARGLAPCGKSLPIGPRRGSALFANSRLPRPIGSRYMDCATSSEGTLNVHAASCPQATVSRKPSGCPQRLRHWRSSRRLRVRRGRMCLSRRCIGVLGNPPVRLSWVRPMRLHAAARRAAALSDPPGRRGAGRHPLRRGGLEGDGPRPLDRLGAARGPGTGAGVP